MNDTEVWDSLSDGMDRPCVQATGQHRRAMGDVWGSIDLTGEDRGPYGRTVRVTHRLEGIGTREYIMTLEDFETMLDDLGRFADMMRSWRGMGGCE